jgi:hypothetical protein
LLDGAMMGGVDSRIPEGQPRPGWLHTVAEPEDPGGAFGPVLFSAQASLAAGQQDLADALSKAVPANLHLSFIHSELAAADLAAHLRQFAKIWADDRQSYFLRFSDCRVLLVLSTVLTPSQWRALTTPMAKWEIHMRDGTRMELPLAGDDGAPAAPPWILSDAQFDACVDAEEPDILLHQLGHTLEKMKGNIHGYWNLAAQCVDAWRDSGSANRQVLFDTALARFEVERKALRKVCDHAAAINAMDPRNAKWLAEQAALREKSGQTYYF